MPMYSPDRLFSFILSGPLTDMPFGGSFLSLTIMVKFFAVLSPTKIVIA